MTINLLITHLNTVTDPHVEYSGISFQATSKLSLELDTKYVNRSQNNTRAHLLIL